MRILVVGARGIPEVEGGAEKNAEMLFPLVAEQHDVTLFSVRSYANSGCYRGVRIVSAPDIRFLRTDKLPCYIMAAVRAVRERPDIVHCQGLGAAIFVFLYKLTARRVVVRYGSADYDMAKWSWLGRLGFRLSEAQLRLADAVIVVTPALKRRLRERGIRTRAELIPNALDPAEAASPSDATVLAGYGLEPGRYVMGIGRITPQKDFATLVRAFQEARRQGSCPPLKLVIAGGSDESGCYDELLREAGTEVIFTGRIPRKQVQSLLRHAAMYVNSSVHEGMSNAILEAVSVGVPLLLTDIVENKDLPLAPHHFFRTGDAGSLSELICAAATDRERFVADRTSFTTWPDVAARTMALYGSLFPSRE